MHMNTIFQESNKTIPCVMVSFWTFAVPQTNQTSRSIYFPLTSAENKEAGKDQESIKSSTTTDPGHHMGK